MDFGVVNDWRTGRLPTSTPQWLALRTKTEARDAAHLDDTPAQRGSARPTRGAIRSGHAHSGALQMRRSMSWNKRLC